MNRKSNRQNFQIDFCVFDFDAAFSPLHQSRANALVLEIEYDFSLGNGIFPERFFPLDPSVSSVCFSNINLIVCTVDRHIDSQISVISLSSFFANFCSLDCSSERASKWLIQKTMNRKNFYSDRLVPWRNAGWNKAQISWPKYWPMQLIFFLLICTTFPLSSSH